MAIIPFAMVFFPLLIMNNDYNSFMPFSLLMEEVTFEILLGGIGVHGN